MKLTFNLTESKTHDKLSTIKKYLGWVVCANKALWGKAPVNLIYYLQDAERIGILVGTLGVANFNDVIARLRYVKTWLFSLFFKRSNFLENAIWNMDVSVLLSSGIKQVMINWLISSINYPLFRLKLLVV